MFEADDLRQQQRERLAEHHRLGLDPAHAPADDPQAVDHRGVAVGADERVGHGHGEAAVGRFAEEDAAGQVFEVDLVDDPDRRRDDPEVAEGLLAPPQEGVPLGIAGELDVDVLGQGVVAAEEIDLHRVVDHQIDRHQRIDLGRIAPQPLHRRPHRRQVDHAGHAGEVLQHDPGRLEGDLLGGRLDGVPGGQRPNVVLADGVAVAGPQESLENHPQRVRQPGGVGQTGVVEGPEPVEGGGAVARLKGAASGEGVGVGSWHGGAGGVPLQGGVRDFGGAGRPGRATPRR
jgi:hypothetical protein